MRSRQSLAAYLLVAARFRLFPFGPRPTRCCWISFVFLYLATVGGGIWSLDFMIQKWRARAPAPRS